MSAEYALIMKRHKAFFKMTYDKHSAAQFE
jgi:hypothetical protein